jgi:chaperonin GroEL
MYKNLLFEQEARKKILKGVHIVSRAVSSTLGPRGQNVAFEESSYPTITKDGVTVSQQIFLKDKFENMGAMLAREAAENTNREAGDGTTTTIALLDAILTEGHKAVAADMNPILIKRGMENALKQVLDLLEKQTKTIKTSKEKKQIAAISANNDVEMGEMVAEVIEKIGTDGIASITSSNSLKTEVEYIKGTKLNSGYLIPHFINNIRKWTVEMNNPKIIITTDDIILNTHILPLLQKMEESGERDCILMANRIEGEAINFLIRNQHKGAFRCVPVKLPSFGEYQQDLIGDLAALTNATVIGKEEGVKIEEAGVGELGTSENVIIGRDFTIFSGAKGNIKKKIQEVKSLLEGEKDTFKIEQLKKRLGRLNGSVANIKAGGASEAEQVEMRYRIEDALNATKSAIEEGVVEGGGMALLRCQSGIKVPEGMNKEFAVGVDIVRKALDTPFKQIVDNGGKRGEKVLGEIMARKKEKIGYNCLTDIYEDLMKAGIIDPKKVVKNEITNAVSTAGILLTCNTAITVTFEDEKNPRK